MNRGLVNLVELRKRFANGEYDFIGNTAYCFHIGDKIVKVYGTKKDKYEFVCIDPKKVCDFSMYKADTIVFPEEYIKENGLPAGEVSNYVNSKKITESFNDDASLLGMIDGYTPLVKDILSFPEIRMNDLGSENILYSNELRYHIIDSTPWEKELNATDFNLFYLNMSLVSTLLENLEMPVKYSKLFNKIDSKFYNNIGKFGTPGKDLQKYLKLIVYRQYDYIGFISSLMEMYQRYTKEDANKLKEIKEFVKVLKKG